MPLPRRPRLKDFSYRGKYRYFLTFCTQDRRLIFSEASVTELTWVQLLRTADSEGFEFRAHVIMPDHAHLLVKGQTSDADLRRFESLAKQHTAWDYWCRTKKRLWQPSFYDHVLREDESELPFVRYILENPVRAGLVARCEDYPFVGAGAVGVAEMIRLLDSAGVKVWTPEAEKDPTNGEGSP